MLDCLCQTLQCKIQDWGFGMYSSVQGQRTVCTALGQISWKAQVQALMIGRAVVRATRFAA